MTMVWEKTRFCGVGALLWIRIFCLFTHVSCVIHGGTPHFAVDCRAGRPTPFFIFSRLPTPATARMLLSVLASTMAAPPKVQITEFFMST